MTLRTQPNPKNRPAPRPPNGGRACGFASGKSTRVKHAPNNFSTPRKTRGMKISSFFSPVHFRPPMSLAFCALKPPKVNKLLRPENCKDFTFRPPGNVQTLQNYWVLAL